MNLYRKRKQRPMPLRYFLLLLFSANMLPALWGATQDTKEVVLLIGPGSTYEKELFAAPLVGRKIELNSPNGAYIVEKGHVEGLFTNEKEGFNLLTSLDLPLAKEGFHTEGAKKIWQFFQGEAYHGQAYKIKGILLMFNDSFPFKMKDLEILEKVMFSFKHFTKLFVKEKIKALAPYVKLVVGKRKNAILRALSGHFDRNQIDEETEKFLTLCKWFTENEFGEKQPIEDKIIYTHMISSVKYKKGKPYLPKPPYESDESSGPDDYEIKYQEKKIASNLKKMKTFPEHSLGADIIDTMIEPKEISGAPPLGSFEKGKETTTHTSNHIGLKITVVVIVVGGVILGVGYTYTPFLKKEDNKGKGVKRKKKKPKKDLKRKSKPKKKKGKKLKNANSNPKKHRNE